MEDLGIRGNVGLRMFILYSYVNNQQTNPSRERDPLVDVFGRGYTRSNKISIDKNKNFLNERLKRHAGLQKSFTASKCRLISSRDSQRLSALSIHPTIRPLRKVSRPLFHSHPEPVNFGEQITLRPPTLFF